MAILWCGGEDVDFPNGGQGNLTISTSAANFRSAFARCAIQSGQGVAYGNGMAHSNNFPGGAVTSCWLSCRMIPVSMNTTATAQPFIGLVQAQPSNAGLFLAYGYVSSTQTILLVKATGDGTYTTLASFTGFSSVLYQVTMQVINYGASATVNVWFDNTQVMTYSGDVTVTGVSSLSAVALGGGPSGTQVYWMSEIIVADEDPRNFAGLVTMAPTAAGTTDQWSGAYTDAAETSLDDSTYVYTGTVNQDEQFIVGGLPYDRYAVRAVRLAARATADPLSPAQSLALGVNTHGTLDAGSSQAARIGGWSELDRWLPTNPVTSAAWTADEIPLLQFNLRSKA